MILSAPFFGGQTLDITPKLLGKFLVRKVGRKRIVAMITEVEAYVGPHDRASHASRGKTPRTEVMFGKPGYWYVYLVYGMHHCLNIVTERDGFPAAILIRSVATHVNITPRSLNNVNMPIDSKIFHKNYRSLASIISGPGRVCKYFRIDRRFNKKPAIKSTGLWIEDRGVRIRSEQIRRGKRIGVDYAGKWKDKPWRFWIK